MLLLARADEHAAPQRVPVDLDDLVFEEARRLRSTTVFGSTHRRSGRRRVHGDVDALRRVVRNLADNAARHASARVDFSLSEQDGKVRFTVDDDGPGIPEFERERVLKRFVRLDEARSRDEGGSGLGLAIVDEVVRAHGGLLLIGQAPAGGARIEITIAHRSRLSAFSLQSGSPVQTETMNCKGIGILTAVGAAAVAIGTGIATAQPDDGEGSPITGEALAKASQAALAFTGGGTVTGTEVGDEESLYEVEVTLADGSQVDVQLNDAFAVVGNKTDPPGSDTEPDAPGN